MTDAELRAELRFIREKLGNLQHIIAWANGEWERTVQRRIQIADQIRNQQ